MTDNDRVIAAGPRVGWIIYEEIGIGSVHIDDMVLSGAIVRDELPDGRVVYRQIVDSVPGDIVYYPTPKVR